MCIQEALKMARFGKYFHQFPLFLVNSYVGESCRLVFSLILLINRFFSHQDGNSWLQRLAVKWCAISIFLFLFFIEPDDLFPTLLSTISDQVPSSDLHLFYQSRIQTLFPPTPNQSRLLKFTCACKWARWTSGLSFSPSWKYPSLLWLSSSITVAKNTASF